MKESLFFLTGAPKSGTTWLGKLLDAHPEISCRGEARVHHFAARLVNLCKGYNDMLVERRNVVGEANEYPLMAWPEVQTLLRTFIENRMRVAADSMKPRFKHLGEKDPEHGLHFKELDPLFPDARHIHIIRDGRGVFISSWHHNVRTAYSHLKSTGFDEFLDITAKQWSHQVRSTREGAKLLGGRYFELRYEDLVAEPEAWMARVLDFLGADADPATVRACVEAASFEKLSQGRKAGEEDKASFFRKGDPNDWRSHLSDAQIRRFDALSGGLLKELGYEN